MANIVPKVIDISPSSEEQKLSSSFDGELSLTTIETINGLFFILKEEEKGRLTCASNANLVSSTSLSNPDPSCRIFDPYCGLNKDLLKRTCEIKFHRLIQTSMLLLALSSVTNKPLFLDKTVLQMGKGSEGLDAAHSCLMPGAQIKMGDFREFQKVLLKRLTNNFSTLASSALQTKNGCQEKNALYYLLFFPHVPTLLSPLAAPSLSPYASDLQTNLEILRKTLGNDPEKWKNSLENQSKIIIELLEKINKDAENLENFCKDFAPKYFSDSKVEKLLDSLYFQMSLNVTDVLPRGFNLLDLTIEAMMRKQLWKIANNCGMKNIPLDKAALFFDEDMKTAINVTIESVKHYKDFFSHASELKNQFDDCLDDLYKTFASFKVDLQNNESVLSKQQHEELNACMVNICIVAGQLLHARETLKKSVSMISDNVSVGQLTNEASTDKHWNEKEIKLEPLNREELPQIPHFEDNIDLYIKRSLIPIITDIDSLRIHLYAQKYRKTPEKLLMDFLKDLAIDKVEDKHVNQIKGCFSEFPQEVGDEKMDKPDKGASQHETRSLDIMKHVRKLEVFIRERHYFEKVYANNTTSTSLKKTLQKGDVINFLLYLTQRMLLEKEPMRNSSAFLQKTFAEHLEKNRNVENPGIVWLVNGSLGEVFLGQSEVFYLDHQKIVQEDLKWELKYYEKFTTPFPGDKDPLSTLYEKLQEEKYNAPGDAITNAINELEKEISKRKEYLQKKMKEVKDSSKPEKIKDLASQLLNNECKFSNKITSEVIKELIKELDNDENYKELVSYLKIHALEQPFLTFAVRRLSYCIEINNFIQDYINDPENPNYDKNKVRSQVLPYYNFKNIVCCPLFLNKFAAWLFPNVRDLKLIGKKGLHPSKIKPEVVIAYRKMLFFMNRFPSDENSLQVQLSSNKAGMEQLIVKCNFSERKSLFEENSFEQCHELAEMFLDVPLNVFASESNEITKPEVMLLNTLLHEIPSIDGFEDENRKGPIGARNDYIMNEASASENLALWVVINMISKRVQVLPFKNDTAPNPWNCQSNTPSFSQHHMVEVPSLIGQKPDDNDNNNLNHRITSINGSRKKSLISLLQKIMKTERFKQIFRESFTVGFIESDLGYNRNLPKAIKLSKSEIHHKA